MKVLVNLLCVAAIITAEAQTFDQFDEQQEINLVTEVLENEMVLDSIVDKALKNSKLLMALNEDVEMYHEEYLQKKRLWYSSFRLGVNIFSANTVSDDFNESVTTIGVLPNVGLSLTIDPERLINRKSFMRQSTNKMQHAQYILDDTKQTIKKKLISEYYQYLTFLESITMRKNLLENRQQHVQLLNASFQTGEASYEQIVVATHQVHLAEESLMKAIMSAKGKRRELEIFIGIR